MGWGGTTKYTEDTNGTRGERARETREWARKVAPVCDRRLGTFSHVTRGAIRKPQRVGSPRNTRKTRKGDRREGARELREGARIAAGVAVRLGASLDRLGTGARAGGGQGCGGVLGVARARSCFLRWRMNQTRSAKGLASSVRTAAIRSNSGPPKPMTPALTGKSEFMGGKVWFSEERVEHTRGKL